MGRRFGILEYGIAGCDSIVVLINFTNWCSCVCKSRILIVTASVSRHLPPVCILWRLGVPCRYSIFGTVPDTSTKFRYEKESILNLSSICLITEC